MEETEQHDECLVNAKPIRPSSDKTDWTTAVEMRDGFAEEIRSSFTAEKVETLTITSANGIYPPWVKCEVWLPKDGRDNTRLRSELEVRIEPRPYNKTSCVVSAILTKGGHKYAVYSQTNFSKSHIAEWILFMLDRGGKPSNYRPIVGSLPWVNRNPIANDYRRNWLTTASIVFAISLFLFVIPVIFPSGFETFFYYAGIAGILAGVFILRKRRRRIHLISQPPETPRDTVPVDSWHTIIGELGNDFENTKKKLIDVICDQENVDNINCATEKYAYRTPTGLEERDRIILSKGQAIVHVHMYLFGEDIFVGWDSYINWSQWREKAPTSVKVIGNTEIEYRELQPGFYIPNNFDIIDLNSLSDYVHRRLERKIKSIIKEKAIDQEIDFSILRGSRESALDKDKKGKKNTKKTGWLAR